MGNDDSTIDKLVALQADRLMRLKQTIVNCKKDSTSRKTKSYFAERLLKATNFYTSFSNTHEELIAAGIPVEHNYIKNDIYLSFEEYYLELHSMLTDQCEKLFPVESHNATGSNVTDTNNTIQIKHSSAIEFARIPTPSFSGKFIDWPSFHDAFEQLIDKNPDLNNMQKFHYLKQSLPSTRDMDVHNMLMTNETYITAWALIKKRYDNPRILFSHHMNSLYELPVLTAENSDSIKAMLNAATVCINEFKRLKIPIETCDHWIVHYLSTKLPRETHKAWERHLGSNTTIPSFSMLESFLTNQLFTIDAMEHRDTAHQTHSKPAGAKSKQTIASTKSTSHSKVNNFHLKQQHNNNNLTCTLCSQPHIMRRCPTFLAKDCFARKEIVDKHRICLNCLSNTHTWSKCTSPKNCAQCGQRHHTLLHFPTDKNITTTLVPSESPQASTSSNLQIRNAHASVLVSTNTTPHTINRPVLLATALVLISNPVTNQCGTFCALIDQGSEGTIISEHVAQSLCLQRFKSSANICGLGENTANKSKYVIQCLLQSAQCPEFELFLQNVHVLPQINVLLPSQKVEAHSWSHIQGLNLADPKYYQTKRIDLIIGADFYQHIILPGIKFGESSQPLAQNTRLGWILSGNVSTVKPTTTKIHCHVGLVELENIVKKFYESEHPNTEAVLSAQDQWCEDYFKTTHVRQPNGKYLVRLPLKSIYDPNQTLGRSKQIAINRFFHLERRLHREPQLFQQYNDAIEDYFKLNQIQGVSSNQKGLQSENAVKSCVLPHHAVIKNDSLTTKVRIVFDASAKTTNGRSLNDILCIGPPLQNDLAAVLLNWRLYKFVFLADIQKMYRCIDMHPEDAQYQRILWRNQDQELKEYYLTTVTFGTASAPFTAIRVLHQLAEDEEHRFPLAAEILRNDIYVDDVLSGGDSLDQAQQKRNQLTATLKSAGMELRKWCSNTPTLLDSIPAEHQSFNAKIMLQKDTIKTLGLNWNPDSDCLSFEIRFDIPTVPTKRNLLSTIARLFDPLGLISPITISAKLILKEIWSTKVQHLGNQRSLDWDEELPITLIKKWQQFIKGINMMNTITVPRWVNTLYTPHRFELHAFCDGSSTSYAAAVFLRVQQQNQITSHLIAAKSRVTPTNPLTIPRIELCGALLSITLTNWVRKHLRGGEQNIPIFYWTDASIVLFWIHGETNRWQTYVSNRVNQILAHSKPEQWGHVGTADNPADCATRGLTPSQLAKFELWWHGPQWLQQDKECWPKFLPNMLKVNEAETEQRPKKLLVNVAVPKDSIILQHSSFSKLIRIHAWIYRFFNNCKASPAAREYRLLTATELQKSVLLIARSAQQQSFSAEINAVERKLALPKNSKLSNLTPFLDDNKILRVRGRLENASLPWSQKHPIILPSHHHVTNIIIDYEHLQTLHGGSQITLTKIRQRFWIINAKRTVNSRIRQCIRCFRQKPEISSQLMGDLPSQRVNATTRPFIATGVDYTGAIELKAARYRGVTSYKGYIAIFICLATKAIHLEAVTGLDTQHFIWALQRFTGRRGLCKDMYSDCGTNFVGANTLLTAETYFSHDGVTKHLASQGIQWHFNPPHSPTFGGLWEANVKATKYHLKRVVGDGRLTYEELSTLLVRIEACLNSRPLCPLTTDTDDLAILTPAHFIITESLLAPPDINQNNPVQRNLTDTFFELQRKVQQFWKRWSCDWLAHLQARPKWAQLKTNLQVGELVIVKEDNLPPHQWRMGRIVEIHPGQDKLVQVVTVKTKTGTYKRSIANS